MVLEGIDKKMKDIIKTFDIASFTENEWKWIAFRVQLHARHNVMTNILHFAEGLDEYYNDKYLGTREERESGLYS